MINVGLLHDAPARVKELDLESRLTRGDTFPAATATAIEADGIGGVSERDIMRWTMAAFYMIAGVAHLTLTDRFLRIVPERVPFPRAVVLLTGVSEIAGSGALVSGRFRRLAGAMLALYAVCVFPANLKHALDDLHRPTGPINRWYHGPRLAFQPVLVWWAMFCAGLTDWPFRPAANLAAARVGHVVRRPPRRVRP
jgi:uncharacterized membrane protein